jgi:hypothetical protein
MGDSNIYFTTENEERSAHRLIVFFGKNGIQPRIAGVPVASRVLGAAGPIEAAEDLVRDPGPGAEEREVKNHAWPKKIGWESLIIYYNKIIYIYNEYL